MSSIKFIDINTSNVFDGSKPYVFWFDEGQSVNLQYIKQICFASKKQNIKVSIPDDTYNIFKLINVGKINTNKSMENLDLATLETNNIISQGWEYNTEAYVHMIYVCASSIDAGEFIGDIIIDEVPYSIGADFYIEDERLLDDLRNFGVEIPAYVQRAVYESNIHEPAIDNILMNRKWKELLLEYINIIANKGSYNSLINSLKWFEWGDLVKIQEYWKYMNYDKDWMKAFDLMSITSDDIQGEMKNYVKTTYIGLFAALDKLKQENGEVEYEDYFNANEGHLEEGQTGIRSAFLNGSLNNEVNPQHRVLQIGGLEGTNKYNYISDENEYVDDGTDGAWFKRIVKPGVHIIDETNPKLEKVSFMWGYRDLALKMTLLGKYFSTYFMPIHLDLINASIENKVYTNTIKILNACDLHRCDLIDHTTGIYCDVDDNSIIRLQDVRCYTYIDTPFSKQFVEGTNWSDYMEDSNITAVGVSLEANRPADPRTYVVNMFGGVGGVMPINFKIDNKDMNRYVIRTLLFDNDSMHYIDNYNIYTASEDGSININATILLKTSGIHQLRFEFVTNSGEILIKKLSINVVDNSWQPFELYKIKRLDSKTLTEQAYNTIYNIFTCNDFVYSQQNVTNKFNTGGTFELSKYSQFVPFKMNPLRNSFGVNHMVKIDIDQITNVLVNGTMMSVSDLQNQLINKGYKVDTYEDCCTPPAHYLLAINPIFLNQDSYVSYIDKTINVPYTNETISIVLRQSMPNVLSMEINGCDIEKINIICEVVGKDRKIYNTRNNNVFEFDILPSLKLFKTSDINLRFEVDYKADGYKYKLIDEECFVQNIENEYELSTESIDIQPINKECEQYIISEYRIFPLFHTLEKLEGPMEISDDELVAVVPNIPMTLKNEDITATWTFVNESTDETISFKPKHYSVDYNTLDAVSETIIDDLPVNQPIIYTIGDNVKKGQPLPKGYYSIRIDYSMGGKVINTSTLTHAFRKI